MCLSIRLSSAVRNPDFNRTSHEWLTAGETICSLKYIANSWELSTDLRKCQKIISTSLVHPLQTTPPHQCHLCMIDRAGGPINDGSSVVSSLEPQAYQSKVHRTRVLIIRPLLPIRTREIGYGPLTSSVAHINFLDCEKEKKPFIYSMSESAETSIFAFPKLSDFNYGSWKTDMKVLLMEKGCWQFILGTEKPCSEGASDREQLAYELRKQRSYMTIYMGVERKY
ncbi:hypothetical protein AVEN_5041-1 [Araneus ventricosus]|uniref:DUF4219 domain-containing protein n=1 Tax=Araneus ventricosus TaxID=182803 RepID=A0A4Y2K106_ARAVE|nr:hypothetical protein AVEN_5041-1 [Araneus ventricosus]